MLYLTLIPAALMSLAIVRFWYWLHRLGYTGEVVGRAPNMLALDGVSLLMAALSGYWSLHGWFGLTLPLLQDGPMADWQVAFLAIVTSVGCCVVAYFNAGERFTHPSLAGMREAALRTLAALRIIDAVELARLVENGQAYATDGKSQPDKGRIIDVKEIRK
jgi:hypothetical protein